MPPGARRISRRTWPASDVRDPSRASFFQSEASELILRSIIIGSFSRHLPSPGFCRLLVLDEGVMRPSDETTYKAVASRRFKTAISKRWVDGPRRPNADKSELTAHL